MRIAAVCSSLVLLASCAVIPDVEYTYYPSKMRGVATITETVSCHSDKQGVVISSSAGFVPTYSADILAGLRRISIRRFEGSFAGFADSDANFIFYDDGRLKSINQTTTGQGETIIKSLVSLGTTVSHFMTADEISRFMEKNKTSPCDTLAKWVPGTDPTKALPSVTLTYTAELNASSTEQLKWTNFKATGASQAIHKQLETFLPTYKLNLGSLVLANHPESYSATQIGPYVNLELQSVAVAELTITAKSPNQQLFKGNIFIPTPQSYYLPIPVAALFGTQKVGLTVAESGLVTQIDYGKNTGLAGAANAANTVLGALSPETASTKASDIKAQADVLAQQARLHRCLTNPTTCQ